ncbi:hypothetical protein IW261DRAFT_1589832 [Armillaria novae-zelandiae]|uniref:Uncharacterized protein n=1 Tax=Armillaria novae-zelandiae TaxID=153914 RepID=A0AA39UL72_9AGAR|nr:hypothetical protein IW261DRAFT_1589832 [Armillaria novae-zelandiae]
MPSLVCTSRIKAVDDHTTVILSSKHCLVQGSPSDAVYTVKQARIPDNIDILLASNLTFTISGLLDKKKVSADCIQRSHLARHIVEYLKTNAAVLGLSTISDVHRGSEDDVPTFTVHSSRYMPSSSEMKSTHLTLTAIHLRYEWKDSAALDSSQLHPFSPNLSLPFLTLLDNLIGRFVTWHLVKRYPLIFGAWFKQLDIEATFFPKIFRMLSDIMKRSPNQEFRSTCKRLLKSIKRKQLSILSSSNASLSNVLAEAGHTNLDTLRVHGKGPELSVEDAFCRAMDHCYRRVIRRPVFKNANHLCAASADAGDDDELALDQVPLLQAASESLRELDILSNLRMPAAFAPLDSDHIVSPRFSDNNSSDSALVDIDLERRGSDVDLDSQSDDFVESDFSFDEELSSLATSNGSVAHCAEPSEDVLVRSPSPCEQEDLSSPWHLEVGPPDSVRLYASYPSTSLEHLMDMDSDMDEIGLDSLSPVSQNDASLFDTHALLQSGLELDKPNFVPPISPAQEPSDAEHLEDLDRLDCLMFFDNYDLGSPADDHISFAFDADVGISIDLDTDDHASSHCSPAHLDSDEEVLSGDREDMVIDHIDCQLEDSSDDEVELVEMRGPEMFEILDSD